MFITEAVTIDSICLSKKYPYVRSILFKDRMYTVVIASNCVYETGETVLFFPDGTDLPTWLLQQLDMWDYHNNRGFLGGKKGTVVKPYYFSRDKSMFSSGFIIKTNNGFLKTPNGTVSIHDKDLVEKLGIRYITKGNPYYFNGDFFLEAVSINKLSCPDLEYAHTNFINQYVFLQEYICGRKFYVTIHRRKSDHHAFGKHKNVYISADNFANYKFLSNTTRNTSGNLYVKNVLALGLTNVLEHALLHNSGWEQLTLGLVLKSTAFGAKNVLNGYDKSNIVCVDAYVGSVPFGVYMGIPQFNSFCKGYGLKTPNIVMENYYDFEQIRRMVNTEKRTALVVRTEDNHNNATLYSEAARMDFIKKNS